MKRKMKGRGCANDRPQQEYITKEESSSPTVSSNVSIIQEPMRAYNDTVGELDSSLVMYSC